MGRYDDVNIPAALEASAVGIAVLVLSWIIISGLSSTFPVLDHEVTGLGRYSGSLSGYVIATLTMASTFLWIWYRRDHYDLVDE